MPLNRVVRARVSLDEGVRLLGLAGRLLRSLIKPGCRFLDVGANVGYYSILFGQLAPKGRVLSFEPTSTAKMLRENLQLTGTKFGCGMALCGACTVHLDGQAVRACVTPVAAVGGRAVTTIEGLAPGGQHPVQRAWVEEDVVQCGYCQPGQIMAAVDLLRRTRTPTDRKSVV